jgi:hypothetical protein
MYHWDWVGRRPSVMDDVGGWERDASAKSDVGGRGVREVVCIRRVLLVMPDGFADGRRAEVGRKSVHSVL